jgi:glycosyltransferase involved in cell wall biosynthesis
MANPTLTIAIPTFNRNAILFQNLKHLLPQIDKNVNILIIDNCSDIKVEGYLKKKLKPIKIKLESSEIQST